MLVRIGRNKNSNEPIVINEGAPSRELITTRKGLAELKERIRFLRHSGRAEFGLRQRENPMDQDDREPMLADILSDPVTLAMMDADGVDPCDLAATLSKIAGILIRPPGPAEKKRFGGSALAKAV